ncbi:MAG TPA: hypothetical protein VKN76_03020 [Kiloniellaceae bacterium]|nr:hypothetical protein [Kiloniellaceae bacterium]
MTVAATALMVTGEFDFYGFHRMSFLAVIVSQPEMRPDRGSNLPPAAFVATAMTKTTTKMTKTAEAAAER